MSPTRVSPSAGVTGDTDKGSSSSIVLLHRVAEEVEEEEEDFAHSLHRRHQQQHQVTHPSSLPPFHQYQEEGSNSSNSNSKVIAFSSGSTLPLSIEERKRGIYTGGDTITTSGNSLLFDLFKRRQVGVESKTLSGATSIVTRDNQIATLAINEEGILASLLLPSVKVRSSTTSNDTQERLYIASRNKVHRPLNKQSQSTSNSSRRKRIASHDSALSVNITTINSSDHHHQARSSSIDTVAMSSSHYSGSGVPGGSNSGTLGGGSTQQQQQRTMNSIHSRDYGYSADSNTSPPNSRKSLSGMMLSSPFNSDRHGQQGQGQGVNPSSTKGLGGSNKASQMLGLSPTPHHQDVYYSQSSTSSFQHTSPSDNGGGGGHSRHMNYSSDRSPTNSTGIMNGGGNGSGSTKDSHVSPPQQNQSHTRMTLKKARSLFSSGKSKNSNSNNNQAQLSPEPSPTGGFNKPMGMGSYGDSYMMPQSTSSSSGFSSHSNMNGPSTATIMRKYGDQQQQQQQQHALNHSKSHGSLAGGGYSTRPSYDQSATSAPLPPLEGAYHPYAASNTGGSRHPHQQSPNAKSPRSVSQGTHAHGHHKEGTKEAMEKDVECPICLESLSIRLKGEKPHVVPLCGHKLHNDCFETAYNTTVAKALRQSELGAMTMGGKNRTPIGICGICRSEMKIGDPSEMGKNKFAMISGQPGRSALPALDIHKIHSISKRTIGPDDEQPASASLHDPSEDQDVLNPHQLLPAYMQHLALGPARSSPFGDVNGSLMRGTIMPKISVRAEHTTLARVSDPEKRVHLTCLVTVEIPSRVPSLADAAHQQGSRMQQQQRNSPQPPHSAHNSQSTLLGYQLSSANGGGGANDRIRTVSNPGTSVTASSSANGGLDGQQGSVFRRESNATTHTHGTEDFPTSPSVSTFSGGREAGRGSISHGLGNGGAHNGGNAGMGHGRILSSGMEKSTSNMTISSAGHTMSQTPNTTTSTGFTQHSTPASSFDEHTDEHHHIGHGAGPASACSSGIHGSGQGGGLSSSSYNPHMNMSATTLTAAQEEKTREAHGPFADVFKDLQDRMQDWKGHEPSTFGSLRMYDSLSVKKDQNVREFVVYLFEEALLCIVDDRRKANHAQGEESEGKLRLKGRVFVKHMKQVEDTSATSAPLSLTIHMEDDSLESFVILFPHRESLEVWRSQIQALIDHHRPPIPSSSTKSSMTTSTSRRDSVFSNDTHRSAQSNMSRNTKATTATSLSHTGSGPSPSGAIPPVPVLKKSMQSLDNVFLDWTPPDSATFVPLDLMLVVSVPRASSHLNGPSSNGLKLRLLKSTLDFIIHAVGPRARISIVAYTTGDSSTSTLRKTPWLGTGRSDGMRRLEQAVSELAGESNNKHDEGLSFVDPKEAKVTVATAVNLALDIMLQRTSKSTTSGMIVLNDSKDGAQRQQIDLVLARTDAGGVPIHTFGWGKTHDPSSLWLLSNHTKGTYTFVRDFYQLREAMAGCIGGMLCVAVHSLRLHLNVQERRWFKIRKVAGVASAIVSSDGKDVDIDLGELRFGERKEMLVEVEMSSPKKSASRRNSSTHRRSESKDQQTLSRKKSLTATDDFFLKKVGMDPLSLGDDELESEDFFEEVEDAMADDVPVFDVSASFKNPQDLTGEVCKLPYPSLLTITVTPPAKTSGNTPDSPASASTTGTVSDPTIVRRRMELLTSDMITRTLLLMSRKQDAGAQRLLMETTRIFSAIIANLIPSNINEHTVSLETKHANEVLQACLEDIEQLKNGALDRTEFDHATRNFGAQQAVALRDQRAWTARTSTEALFFCREWTAIFGKALTNQL